MGRPKGALGRDTRLIREMISEALDEVGGVEYLVEQAKNEPKAFLSLIGKVLPVQLNHAGAEGKPLSIFVKYD